MNSLSRGMVALTAASAIGLAAAGCGGGDDDTSTEASAANLSAIKDYLTEHTAALQTHIGELQAKSDEYFDLAASVNFDYARLMAEHGGEVAAILDDSKTIYVEANPNYEQMEGIVAGVPRLSQYDVDIDAGADASDPENAVSYSLKTEDGQTLKQPGNLFFLTETALYGTEPKFLAKGVKRDVDGDGKVEFGEGLPDAQIYKATLDEFAAQAASLDEDAQAFEPTDSDAFTALTIMVPTMSEYFESWKNSAFVAGRDNFSERAFVATSRLSDITDILGGLVLTYDQVKPLVAEQDPQQAEQTEKSLQSLHDFAAGLRDQEAGGRKFTAEEADTLGAEAQAQAEAIAGQITQAAARANVEIQEA